MHTAVYYAAKKYSGCKKTFVFFQKRHKIGAVCSIRLLLANAWCIAVNGLCHIAGVGLSETKL